MFRFHFLGSLISTMTVADPAYQTITDDNEEPPRRLLNSDDNEASAPTTTMAAAASAPSAFHMNAELVNLILVAAATASTLGFDVGIMAAAIQPLEQEMDLTPVQKEVAMGSLNFFAAAGALIGGRVANQLGRQPTVKVCAWLFVIGTVCMALAPNYATLLIGRIVTGLGVGVSFVVAPVYLSEVAPTAVRGLVNTVFDVAINGGILLGYVIGFVVQVTLPEDAISLKWRTMLGLGLLLPLIVLLNLHALPESPRWLVMQHQTEAATQVLIDLGESPQQAARTVLSIQDELQQAATHHVSMSPTKWSPGMHFAVQIGFWQQITGTEAVLYYSADFLEHAGLASATQRLLGNCAVGLCKLVPELLAMQVVDKIGRRPLILASTISLTLSTATLALAFWKQWSPMAVVVLLCAIMSSFSVGLGPFSFLLASENLGLAERATGVTLCAAANRCTSGTVAMTAVTLYNWVGPAGLFAIYATVGCMSFPFYFYQVQETSGQSLEALAARQRHHHNHTDDGYAPHEQQQQQQLHQQHHTPFSDNPEVEVVGAMT